MKFLSILHRWSGGFIGFLLAVLGLSGTLLVWKDSWIGVPGAHDRLVDNVAVAGRIADQAVAAGATRITFAGEELGLHQVGLKGGAGSYVNQAGETVAGWSSQWQRPELWIFDLHHHLFFGETGELAAGIAGFFGLAFVITGSILWWRSRRTFEFRLWPRRFQPGPIIRHHRDLGIILAPLLLVSFVTGVGQLFPTVTGAVLAPFGRIERGNKPPEVEAAPGPVAASRMIAEAKARFPHAELRRLTGPREAGGAWSVRMRQPFEWTPHGRTTLWFDGSGRLERVDDPASGSRASAIQGTLYPIHSGKVAGWLGKLAMTLSGIGLTLLGAMAMWSFWWRKLIHRQSRRPSAYPATIPDSDRISEAAI
jgi:uncharacterized iron-regulated membrane protein